MTQRTSVPGGRVSPAREGRRLRRAGAVAAFALALAPALAACDGSPDEPAPAIDSTLVDGKVCGLFTKGLVVSVIGHPDVAVRGTGVADADKRTNDTINCEVIDDQRVRTTIQVVVGEQPKTGRATVTAMLGRERADKTGCSTPSSVEALGPGYVCRLPNGQVALNVLLTKRLVRLVYQPGPDAEGDSIATAVELAKDVDANVDAYDEEHAG
jgi:hypothetical protein